MRDRIVTDAFGFGAGGHEESAGFGVRVIHSGVWGFASSPFVTEDEIKKITAQATEVAKASAVSKRFEVKLAPVDGLHGLLGGAGQGRSRRTSRSTTRSRS